MMPPRFQSRQTMIRTKRELLEQAARDLVDGAATEVDLRAAARAFVHAERATYGRRRLEVA